MPCFSMTHVPQLYRTTPGGQGSDSSEALHRAGRFRRRAKSHGAEGRESGKGGGAGDKTRNLGKSDDFLWRKSGSNSETQVLYLLKNSLS